MHSFCTATGPVSKAKHACDRVLTGSNRVLLLLCLLAVQAALLGGAPRHHQEGRPVGVRL